MNEPCLVSHTISPAKAIEQLICKKDLQ